MQLDVAVKHNKLLIYKKDNIIFVKTLINY